MSNNRKDCKVVNRSFKTKNLKRSHAITSLIDELIDLHESITRACCRSYRLSQDMVDDVIHDTFLAAYRTLPNYRGQTKMGSWLWTIAQSQIINQMRKQSTRKRQEVANPKVCGVNSQSSQIAVVSLIAVALYTEENCLEPLICDL